MATKPWSELPICTPEDVLDEVDTLGLVLHRSGADLDALVATKIKVAKNLLRQDLLVSLEEIYATNATYWNLPFTFAEWYQYAGYTWSQLDGVLDLILNPEELKPVGVAYTLRACLVSGMFANRVNFNDNSKNLADIRTWLEGDGGVKDPGELKRRFRRCAHELLKIDLNKDGVLTDMGRVITKRTLWRV